MLKCKYRINNVNLLELIWSCKGWIVAFRDVLECEFVRETLYLNQCSMKIYSVSLKLIKLTIKIYNYILFLG